MAEDKKTEKKEEKPKVADPEKTKKESVPKKEEKKTPNNNAKKDAVVNGRSLPISTKHSVAICGFIRNKDIDKAIYDLEMVEKKKIPVPMEGEIPHKKGIMSGRYPVKASQYFIKLLKSLKSNALNNELELEKFKLSCMANVASRPYKRFGRGRFKRSHVTIKLIPIKNK